MKARLVKLTLEDDYNLVSLFVFKRRNYGLSERDKELCRKLGLHIQMEA